jgi:hypothetical protein
LCVLLADEVFLVLALLLDARCRAWRVPLKRGLLDLVQRGMTAAVGVVGFVAVPSPGGELISMPTIGGNMGAVGRKHGRRREKAARNVGAGGKHDGRHEPPVKLPSCH